MPDLNLSPWKTGSSLGLSCHRIQVNAPCRWPNHVFLKFNMSYGNKPNSWGIYHLAYRLCSITCVEQPWQFTVTVHISPMIHHCTVSPVAAQLGTVSYCLPFGSCRLSNDYHWVSGAEMQGQKTKAAEFIKVFSDWTQMKCSLGSFLKKIIYKEKRIAHTNWICFL